MISPQAYEKAGLWSYEIASNHEVLHDPKRFRNTIKQKAVEIGIPNVALQSLVRNASLSHTKRHAPQVKRNLPQLLDQYKKGSSIVTLAREVNYSPYLLARYMAEGISTFQGKMLSEAMRDPEGLLGSTKCIKDEFLASEANHSVAFIIPELPTTRLAGEVRDAITGDPLYGPMHDKERHIIGIEYEVVLEEELKELGIPFETEAILRGRGTSRTPDILLSCPLGVQVQKEDGSGTSWKMITWIDSKAMFGDVETHKTSVLPQAEAYIHRYGPGMVLYWFGHAPLALLGNSQGDIVIASSDLPHSFMWPTGQVLKREI